MSDTFIFRALGVSPVPPVEEQPALRMTQWAIYELANQDHHLCGHVIGSKHDGRVTSKIMHREGRHLVTRSGRKYELVGPSGWNQDGYAIWLIWCRTNNIDGSTAIDVSIDYVK